MGTHNYNIFSSLIDLYNIYEKNNKVGEVDINGNMLLPIGFTTMVTNFEICIDTSGKLCDVLPLFIAKTNGENGEKKVKKLGEVTPIPCTEASAKRSGTTIAPHPLFDSIMYMSNNVKEYMNKYKSKLTKKQLNLLKTIEKYHPEYMYLLKQWRDYESNPKVKLGLQAIYEYLDKNSLIYDLANRCPEYFNGFSFKGDSSKEIWKMTVRIKVSDKEDVIKDSRIWLDKDLHTSFQNFYNSCRKENIDLCYMTGERTQITYSFPKSIRYDGEEAKIISSNDTEGYTFRGRLQKKEEAISIGYEASYKAHNMLKYLIRNQGYRKKYGIDLVVWQNRDNCITPQQDLLFNSICGGSKSTLIEIGALTADYFNKALDGYIDSHIVDDNFNNHISNMSILTLGNAVKGRLAITNYTELSKSDYIKNIRSWYSHCSIVHQSNKQSYIFTPALNKIAYAIFGTEIQGKLTLHSNSDKKQPKLISTVRSLLPCIMMGRSLPEDIVKEAVFRASNPLWYKDKKNYNLVFNVAYSLVRKYYYDKNPNKGELSMALDTTCTDRSYLFGRLLAVAECMEKQTYNSSDKKSRRTNAERMMAEFRKQPFAQWPLLEAKLDPYRSKLSYGSRIYFDRLFSQIHDLFVNEEFSSKEALNGKYLLGYYNQKTDIYKGKPVKNKENNTDGEIEIDEDVEDVEETGDNTNDVEDTEDTEETDDDTNEE